MKSILIIVIITVGILIALLLYIIPNVGGNLFVNIEVREILRCNKLYGFLFIMHNTYFMPVILHYEGADLVVDLFDKSNSNTYRASYSSELFHDDEEGLVHLAVIEPGISNINVTLTSSSEYYRTLSLPDVEHGNYYYEAGAFGLETKALGSTAPLDVCKHLP